MEIIIGSMPPLDASGEKAPLQPKGIIEAQLLHVRPPRKGIAGPSGAERRGRKTRDPVKGRVLTLMVADAESLPKDIDKAKYRVSLRFHRM
ncbi:MAG: hypothetical protein V2I36_19005 [Desulfopila sp.]|jgi:hypothetical protein|nr:hypothetical protein [Desulfopila sp.]